MGSDKITRRDFLASAAGTAAGAAAAAVPLAAALGAPSGTPGRPNVLLIIADDLGDGDLGCYGHPTIRSENLDRLATQGMRFTGAFVATSSCSPCRASLFTGRYPHATGAEDLHVPLPAEQKILPAYLSEAGYYTANVEKLHLGDAGAAQFDRVEDEREMWRSVLNERPKDRPFFLSMGFRDPHRPYQPDTIPDPTDPADVVVPPYLADTPETHADLAGYYDEITRMDREVGKMLAWLETQGEAENTLVIFHSDNGMPFPRAKTTCYDSGIRTPMIVRWPGRVPAGEVSDSLISTVDLAPSILALLGLEVPARMQGLDMSRVLTDPDAEAREYIYAERNWHNLDDHQRAARDKRYKYIKNFFPRRFTIASDLLRSPSYESLLRLRDLNRLTPEQMRLFMIPRAGEELYDTWNDPYEFTNLAGDPKYSGILERLRAECERWTSTTGDVPPGKRRKDNLDIFTREKYGKLSGEPEIWIDEEK